MRRKILSAIAVMVLSNAWVTFAVGQAALDAPKLPRIGWLGNYSPNFPNYQGFHQGLRELGYIEGKNVTIEARWAEGKLDRLPGLARELAGLNVDVLLVGAEEGLRAAKQATATIPIVVVTCDPLDKLVASIARPGGKATGVTCISSELTTKRLQVLKDLMPQLARVAVLYHSADDAKSTEYNDLIQAAGGLNLAFRSFVIRSESELGAAFSDIAADSPQALIILANPFMNFRVRTLSSLALKHRLPTIYGFREYADAGGLISYGASRRENYRRAATYIDKILKGANPGDLPIELPTKFELVINLKAAKAIDLTVPATLLALADEVIE